MENLDVQTITLIVVLVMLALSLITAFISLLLETDRTRQWYGDWFQGVSTEMIGAVVTTIFFAFIVGAVQEQQEVKERKEELMTQLGSVVNAEAVRAAEELARREWLADGTLHGIDMNFADLSNARLFTADFEDATMYNAILRNTDLTSANLTNVNMEGVDLQGARLDSANLQSANLYTANLQSANLASAVLNGANLELANLEGVNLTNAQFNTETILPDGTNWSSDTDMTRFTDSANPDFWRPEPNADGFLPWWMTDEGE